MNRPTKHYPISILAGTFTAYLISPTVAIAQTYLSCTPPATSTGDLIRFGVTNRGNQLELDRRSIHSARNGTRFTYYLRGRRVRGLTNCQESAWYVRGNRIPAESVAARAMLNYVCGFRVSGF